MVLYRSPEDPGLSYEQKDIDAKYLSSMVLVDKDCFTVPRAEGFLKYMGMSAIYVNRMELLEQKISFPIPTDVSGVIWMQLA